ncbi:hypothetical protein EDB83DRAFT_2312843 [Lactarius deliciosus]|nr:hypothetical protein EDB83DRAFT_2312843 [Lactarius deliciosus]
MSPNLGYVVSPFATNNIQSTSQGTSCSRALLPVPLTMHLHGFVHSPHLRLPHISVIAHEFHVGKEGRNFIPSLNVAEPIGRVVAVSAITYIGQARRTIWSFLLTNGAGIIADIWDPVNRAIEMSVLSTAIIFGPVLGPIVSSLLKRIGTELLGGHLPERVGDCGPDNHPLVDRRSFPLFTTQVFVNVGINWAYTLLEEIAVLLVPMPFLFYKYGSYICTRSSLTPCTDLEVVKFLGGEKAGAVKRDRSGFLDWSLRRVFPIFYTGYCYGPVP